MAKATIEMELPSSLAEKWMMFLRHAHLMALLMAIRLPNKI
jgi:hypothetical protein